MKKTLTTKDYKLKTGKTGGFTLVETLVSLFIFSLSVTAIIVVSGKGVADTTIAKNKIIAVALAQEGIEIMRNIRDTYALSEANPGEGWTDFVNAVARGGMCGPNGCIINDTLNYSVPIDSFIENCNPAGSGDFESGCDFLTREKLVSDNTSNVVSTLGFYNYDSAWPETSFKRTLYIDCIGGMGNCSEIRVESLVEWRQGTTVTSVNAVEHLFNWFKTVPAVTP